MWCPAVWYKLTDFWRNLLPPSSVRTVSAQLLPPHPHTSPSGSFLTHDTPPFLVSINTTIQVTANNGGLTLWQTVPSALNARSPPSPLCTSVSQSRTTLQQFATLPFCPSLPILLHNQPSPMPPQRVKHSIAKFKWPLLYTKIYRDILRSRGQLLQCPACQDKIWGSLWGAFAVRCSTCVRSRQWRATH